MFSINLVTLDSYQSKPIPEIDLTFSNFRGSEIRQIPVIRIFGSTLTGIKTCLHIHGVFPYIYVPCTTGQNTDSYMYQLASALDTAINVSFGNTMSKNQHVYKIQLVSGIPIYGYHTKEHLFFKIYFYNPAIIKRAADILQNGTVLNQNLQPHEVHIPFILQFMIDYNLYGMSMINLRNVKYRRCASSASKEPSQRSSASFSDSQKYLPLSVAKQSTCELEVDAVAYDVMNKEDLLKGLDLNPGIAAIWNNEKARRSVNGLPDPKIQLLYSQNENRIEVQTDNDVIQEQRLARRLDAISQVDDSCTSSSDNTLSYPIEKDENTQSLNVSSLENHYNPTILNRSAIVEPILRQNSTELQQLELSALNNTTIMDADDMHLVELLANLATNNDADSIVDDDSILGSQSSALSKQAAEDNEIDDAEDLNITAIDLDSLSSWNSIPGTQSQPNAADIETSSQSVATEKNDDVNDKKAHKELFLKLPQCDGTTDLLEHTYKIERNKKKVKYEKLQSCSIAGNISFNIDFNSDVAKSHELDHKDLDVFDPDDLKIDTNAVDQLVSHSMKPCKKLINRTKIHSGQDLSFPIPALDGNGDDDADDDSHDSESKLDITIQREEKRICVYKRRESENSRDAITTTPKKRQCAELVDSISPFKRRKVCSETSQEELNKTPKSCRKRSQTPRSPRSILARYTPLKVTITSPKSCRNTIAKRNIPMNDCTDPEPSTLLSCSVNSLGQGSLRVNLLQQRSTYDVEEKGNNAKLDESHQDSQEFIGEGKNIAGIGVSNSVINNTYPRSSKEVRKRLSFVTQKKITPTTVEHRAFQHTSDNLPLTELRLSRICENGDDEVIALVNKSTRKEVFDTSDNVRPVDNAVCASDSDDTLALSQEEIEDIDLNVEENDDICDMTFTQCIAKKLEESSQKIVLPSTPGDRRERIITTRFNPPSKERIIESMKIYNILENKFTTPWFSDKTDLIKYKETAKSIGGMFELVGFKSSLDMITGIRMWRRMKVNELHPSGSTIKTCNIKQTLAGYNALTIKPLVLPPSQKDIRNWLKAKEYLKRKNDKLMQIPENNAWDIEGKIIKNKDVYSGDNKSEMPIEISNSNDKSSDPILVDETASDETHSGMSSELKPSLQKILENPILYRNNQLSQHLGISFGQIEYSTKNASRNIDDENFQNARATALYQYLTLLSLEVHVTTRSDLLPDPEQDPIEAIFYAIYDDTPMSSSREQFNHGAIIINSPFNNSRLKTMYSAVATCPVSFVTSEEELINSLITLVQHCDPDILLGWEIETLSWGYVFQRASCMGFRNIMWELSRILNAAPTSAAQMADKDNFTDPKVPGRIMLDVWRIMRHETALLNYSFENVMYNVLRERIPYPTFETLTEWWKSMNIGVRWRVIDHYVVRVLGTLRILIQLDIIGRTCEHARLIGIQFYELFSRGSQFRVESMMLRLAKPLNYIPVSPSVQQRAKMRAPEVLPLIMEPESVLYVDPVIVLDFQSLYPSIIIAYNYCFSTCLGRVEHIGQYSPFEFGATTLRVTKNTALKLQGKINFSPCGVAFVKSTVRQGILPRMLTEILNTRLMIKDSMKVHGSDNKLLQRVLDSQQLGLKLIANVTYGYTAANFSGRMPCIEVGDSVVSKGRETLERAIKIVETTPKWGARVIYGDTDSLFLLLPGKSKEEAFTIGNEIADTVTAANPAPVKLKFEKVLQPCILQTKKRYCGYMYESPDQNEPTYLAKGIETVRRDGCPAVAKILEKTLKILFDTKDLSLVKKYVTRQFDKILRRRISIQDLTFAREFRGLGGYKSSACVPALELTRRLMRKDPRAVPRTGERVRYVIVSGAPNEALIHCVRTPMEVIKDEGLVPNSMYYITKVIVPPLNRCLNLIGIDVNLWFRQMSHRQTPDKVVSLFTDNQKSTIRQYFSTNVCAACGEQAKNEICVNCMSNTSQTITVLYEKVRWFERTHRELIEICQSCTRSTYDPKCESLDCPILYRRMNACRDLIQVPYLTEMIKNGNNSKVRLQP